MIGPANNELTLKIGPFNSTTQSVSMVDFVVHFDDNTWDNNNGQDYHIPIGPATEIRKPAKLDVSFGPVPTTGTLRLNIPFCSDPGYEIKILDAEGKLVFLDRAECGPNKLELSELEAGVYFLEITGNRTRKTCIGKVVKL